MARCHCAQFALRSGHCVAAVTEGRLAASHKNMFDELAPKARGPRGASWARHLGNLGALVTRQVGQGAHE